MEKRTEENWGEGKELARYRLRKPGGLDFFARKMNISELSERRIYLRKVLAQYPSVGELSDSDLEDVRLYCAVRGYIFEDADGYQFFLAYRNVTEQETEFRRVRSMMPFEFLDALGSSFDWTKYETDAGQAKNAVNRYVVHYDRFSSRGMGLYIYSGTKGSGKTMLACCLLNEIAKRHRGSVKFVNILDYLEMAKKGFDGYPEEMENIHSAGLLVVDDIGVQMNKEWINAAVYQLVNDRYTNRQPTIYTSNLPVEALKMDDRITDRISSTTYSVHLPEEPVRGRERQREKEKLLAEIENVPG